MNLLQGANEIVLSSLTSLHGNLNLCDALRLTSDIAGCVNKLCQLFGTSIDHPSIAAPAVLRASLVLCLRDRYEDAARTLGASKVLYEEVEGVTFAPRDRMVNEIEERLTDALSEDRWRELELAGRLLSPEETFPAITGYLRDIS